MCRMYMCGRCTCVLGEPPSLQIYINVVIECCGQPPLARSLLRLPSGLSDTWPPCPAQAEASVASARELLLLSRTINQTVGDAISGVLLVEAVLRYKSVANFQTPGVEQTSLVGGKG